MLCNGGVKIFVGTSDNVKNTLKNGKTIICILDEESSCMEEILKCKMEFFAEIYGKDRL
jgi:hypothetical protein